MIPRVEEGSLGGWVGRHLTRLGNHPQREKPNMCIIIKARFMTHIPESMTAEEIKTATLDDKHLGMMSEFILYGWPLTEAEVQKEVQPYWSFRD